MISEHEILAYLERKERFCDVSEIAKHFDTDRVPMASKLASMMHRGLVENAGNSLQKARFYRFVKYPEDATNEWLSDLSLRALDPQCKRLERD